MRFHIKGQHSPENCFSGHGLTSPVSSWPERCKERGIEFVAGGQCNPEHSIFLLVETDDMDKITESVNPVLGRFVYEVTPVRAVV